MSSVEESSLVESKTIPTLDSTHEPTPEPQTLKERLIHPSEFAIEFRDYSNTSKYIWHNPYKEASPKVESAKEWLLEVKCSSKTI